jgi:hypothetical protein
MIRPLSQILKAYLKGVARMKVVTLPRKLLNPLALPGMGRSLEVHMYRSKKAKRCESFQSKERVQFEGGKGTMYPVINLWPDPHDPTRVTLFIE